MNKQLELIKSSIKSIPNHPKEGIIFRDITSLLEVPTAFKATIDLIVEKYKDWRSPSTSRRWAQS